MEINEQFIENVAKQAIQQQVERAIKRQVENILDELLGQLLGHYRSRKGPRKGISRRLPDFRKFLRARMEDACLGWIKEVLNEELGKDLLEYVLERCEFGGDEEDDEEDGFYCDECDRPESKCIC